MKRYNLNRKLVLETPQRVPDDAGGYSQTWVALGTLWADFRPGAGREARGDQVALSKVSYRVMIRAALPGSDARPVAGQRFREDMRIFTIDAVRTDDADQRYLTCFVIEEAVT